MNNLWSKPNYRSPCQFIIDKDIYEYDIRKANINVLIEAGIITQEQYDYLYNAPKNIRSITIGKLQGANPNVTKALKEGIANARKSFMELNNINDQDIIAIRNDAITYVGREPTHLQMTDHIAFRESGRYTSFYRINTIDLLYYFNIVDQAESMDVKGLGDAVDLHRPYMLDFLCELFYTAQIEGVQKAIYLLQSFHNDYINMKLDIGYYRELNTTSYFKLKDMSSVSPIYADTLTEYDKRYLDIGYNEFVLRFLNKIYASIYFGKQ